MKSSMASIGSKLNQTPRCYSMSNPSTKVAAMEGNSKQKSFSVIPQSPKIERMEKKEKYGNLENISRDPIVRSGGQQSRKSGALPPSRQERYSTGSPKLSTPLRSTLRSSEVSNLTIVRTPEVFSTVRFETPKRNTLHEVPGSGVETSNLVVAVRVRPQTEKEKTDKEMKPIVNVKENEVIVLTDYGQTHSFNYDYCFLSNIVLHDHIEHDQSKIYDSLAKPLLSQAFKGFNTSLFAYGQTGSGKSYSVMGNIGCENELHFESGIVPRFCHDLFREVELLIKDPVDNFSIEIQISYFEIYKEKIQDLLCPSSKLGGSLRVREHPQNGPYVVDLSKHAVTSFEEVQRWLVVGNRQRATASTSANEHSSRSHAIFTIILAQSHDELLDGKSHEVRKQSRINFIDLAGSERVASCHAVGDRREEGLTINQSLLTLGRVITALAEQKFVPYRESVLTWLLKESLGGDSKTVMLATVSPCTSHVEETLSTLRYACQARKIVNTARIGEDPNSVHIRNLRHQIKLMENRLNEANARSDMAVADGNIDESSSRVQQLESEIRCLKSRLTEVENQKDVSWQEKVTQAELRRREAEEALAKCGVSTVQDPKQPCLVNVNQDPLLSGTLFFPLKLGQNWVGPSVSSANSPTIQLTGLMIEESHCCIERSGDHLTLVANGETYVNGQLVSSPGLQLHHGDRIIIGGTHYFHLYHPSDSQFHGNQSASNKFPDFETAHEELRLCQEHRLQLAIKDAQEKAKVQLMAEMEEVRQEAALEISLQRHSYEDEIASLNRVLEERQVIGITSPPSCSPSITKSTNLEEIESLLQDTQRKLALPTENSEESSFVIQSMLNEINAICRRFQQPYAFTRRDALTDDLQPMICVQDLDRQLVMYWSIDTMRKRMEVLRQAIDESGKFPTATVFERGDVWQLEDGSSALFVPALKEKLDKLLKCHDSSMSVLDDSRFSIDSSRRSSLRLSRSPTINTGVAETCKELIRTFHNGDLNSTFCSAASSLKSALDHPDRTYSFAIPLTVHALSLLSVYPGLVSFFVNKRDVLQNVRNNWLHTTKELGQRLQNSLEFVMQGITLDSAGLFKEWVRHTQNTLNSIFASYYELSVVFCDEVPNLEVITASTAIAGFVTAQTKVHESIVDLADNVRMKIAQLPDENSLDSLDNSSFTTRESWLVKASHDVVTQVQILLEQFTETIGSQSWNEKEMAVVYSKFHQRIDILLRMGTTIENLLSYLELADLSQIKMCAAALEVQATAYTNQMGVTSDVTSVLCDVSFAVNSVHKIVAERRRMTVLRRGRDISYSPLPARLLASSPRKSSHFDDVMESETSGSASETGQSDEESLENVSISPSAIKKALLFSVPLKSSLKSNGNVEQAITIKSVRFNVSDFSPSHDS
ncbi:kinesin-like protein KIF14 [Daphnia carinata]|uniref:kinesin-like protein KIF14 n=1 Tax=Daphnia carinata TaxID=120202 RepID=UPI00257DF750|nr:kinesin-like protein KIF14 [Daphnia carinata]